MEKNKKRGSGFKRVLWCDIILQMNTSTIEIKVNELTNEVRGLKNTISRLSKLIERIGIISTKERRLEELEWSDPNPDELVLHASQVFGVSSKPSLDDENIASNAVVKPVDFSGYA